MQVQRVLVVDNEPLICEMLRDCLDDEGWLTVCAGNAAEALHVAVEADVALVDPVLPGTMSGLELVSRLEANGIPVLLMSGRPDALAESVGTSPRRVLRKPFRIATLLTALRELDRRGARRGERRRRSSRPGPA